MLSPALQLALTYRARPSRSPPTTLARVEFVARQFVLLVAPRAQAFHRKLSFPRLAQLAEQRLRVPEISCVESFGEQAINRGEKIAGLGVATLVATEPGEARGSAQLPELGLLLLGDHQGFAIELLSDLGSLLPQQQLAFVPIQLRREPSLPDGFGDLQRIICEGQGLFDLPCGLGGLRQHRD